MKKIFIIIWADPKFYQTLVSLSQKLSRNKFKVFIISRNLDYDMDIIKKVNFGKNVELLKSPNFINFKLNKLNYLIFNFFIVINLILKKPKNVIYFNRKALFNILIAKLFFKQKTKYIYHNFDFDSVRDIKKLNDKILIKLEFFCSKMCNYLIFPSKERSRLFKNFSKNYSSKYYSMMNCFPKKLITTRSQKFKKFIKKNQLQTKNVICHLGSIGPNHFLEEIVDSFKFINNDYILVLAGTSINGYVELLKEKIKINNLDKKIYILEDISNSYWFEILKKSKLGLCFYKQSSLSHRHMAGTSQKFNNYLFFNLPMIVNNNLDFKKFKKDYDIFEIVDPKKPKKIAQKIHKLFSQKFRYQKIKTNMNKAFDKDLNFDKQFKNSYKKFILNS